MARTERVTKPSKQQESKEGASNDNNSSKVDEARQTAELSEELLKEIDDLLAEVDAEAFVQQYIQKGGQ